MRILWVKTDFLHPTTRGGQIRTLEMLRQMHRKHEIHYVAFDDPKSREGVERASEYSSYAYPIHHQVTPKTSPRFAIDLLSGVTARLPVAGSRYISESMRSKVAELESKFTFDAKVCDFLTPSVNISDLRTWTLFQHNVESIIWERHAQAGATLLHRAYFAAQAKKMLAWEQEVCRAAANVIAVSDIDAQVMRDRFALKQVEAVPTGVDINYFARPETSAQKYDLVFVGSMDWMPNVDGMRWFLSDVLPLIRAKRPACKLAIVGRNPPTAFATAAREQGVDVTGTVPDVRPFLWQSAVSIVPLRIGGGTRLKIFEAMAAGNPVVATTVGAEGLPTEHGQTIELADTPGDFANSCLRLLDDRAACDVMRDKALRLVVDGFSWEQVTARFERLIFQHSASTVSR